MSKSNKELAVDVAIELIKANPRLIYKNDNVIAPSLTLSNVTSIIESVNATLEKIDKDTK